LRFGLVLVMAIGLLGAACTPPPPAPEVISYYTSGGGLHPDAPPLVVLAAPMDPTDALQAINDYTRQWALGDVVAQPYIVEGIGYISGPEPWPAPEVQTPQVNLAVINSGTDALVDAIQNNSGVWSAAYDPALGLLVKVNVDYGGGPEDLHRIETLTLP
jgi:hypothetical protein